MKWNLDAAVAWFFKMCSNKNRPGWTRPLPCKLFLQIHANLVRVLGTTHNA